MVAAFYVSWSKISQAILHLASVNLSFIKSYKCPICTSRILKPSHAPAKVINPLSRLDHKDWLAPNEVLKIIESVRDPELMHSVWKKLSQRKDYRPNEALYSLIIEKLASAHKFDAIEDILGRVNTENCKLSDDFFYRLIKIYGNVISNLDLAIKTLLKMPDYHCWPSNKTFNFVLNMLVCAKQFDVIHEVYLSAPRLGIKVDTCSLNILVKGLCQCDKLDSALDLLDEFPKQDCRPNATTYSTLMHGLCKHDKLEEAFELFGRLEREGCHPDTITFNILISGLCKQRRLDEAKELMHKMQLKGCAPNSGSYQALLYGLLSSDKYVEATDFINQMILKGISPSFMSYKLLIEGLCKQNLLNDMDWVIKQMVRQGFVPRMGTWKKILESTYSSKNCFKNDHSLMQNLVEV